MRDASATGAKAEPSKADSGISRPKDAPENPRRIRIKVNAVNLRSSPELRNENILGQLYRGEELRVISKTGDWYEVETTKGRRGFVTSSENYVEALR